MRPHVGSCNPVVYKWSIHSSIPSKISGVGNFELRRKGVLFDMLTWKDNLFLEWDQLLRIDYSDFGNSGTKLEFPFGIDSSEMGIQGSFDWEARSFGFEESGIVDGLVEHPLLVAKEVIDLTYLGEYGWRNMRGFLKQLCSSASSKLGLKSCSWKLKLEGISNCVGLVWDEKFSFW